MPPRKRLGQLLTELGVVDEHQLQSALGHQKQWGGKLGAILVQKGFCKEEEVVSALSRHLGMPRVKLAEQKIDPRASKYVSKLIAEKLHVFAYEVSGVGRGEVVTIAMSDPTDLSAVDQLAFHTGKRIKPMLAGDSEIVSAIAEHYGVGEEKPRPPTGPIPGAPPAAPRPAAPAGAGPGAFPRRIDPGPNPSAPSIPRFTPVMTPQRPPYVPPPVIEAAPEPEPIPEPPLAQPTPVELPEEDGEAMALEPIAAHTQVGEVEGQADFTGGGSAEDSMEGFEPAGNAQAAAQENWTAQPGAGWDAAGGWESPAAAAPAAPVPLPAEEGWGAPAEPLPDWGDLPKEQAWTAGQEPWAAEAKAEEHTAESAAVAAEAPVAGEQPAEEYFTEASTVESEAAVVPAVELEPGEELPADAILGTADEEPAAEEWAEPAAEPAPEPAVEAAEEPARELLAGPAAEPEEAPAAEPEEAAIAEAVEEPAAESAEAPDAWASSEDPLAAAESPDAAAAEPAAPQWGQLNETEEPAAEEPAAEERWGTGEALPGETPVEAEAAHAEQPAAHAEEAPEAGADEAFAAEEAPHDAFAAFASAAEEAPPGAVAALAAEEAEPEAVPAEEVAPEADAAEEPDAAAADVFAEASHESFAVGEPQEQIAEGHEAFPLEGNATPEERPPAGELTQRLFGLHDGEAPSEPELAGEAVAEEQHAAAAHADPSLADTPPDGFRIASAAEATETPHEEEAPPAGSEAAGVTPQETPVFGMEPPETHETEPHAETAESAFASEPPPAEFEAHVDHQEPQPEVTELAADAAVDWSDSSPADEAAPEGAAHLEGWIEPPVAPPAPEGAGWLGEALSASAPLSAHDLGTLEAVGIDANDGVAGLRLLASLLRALDRRGLIDFDEIASEVHESRTQGEAPAVEHAPATPEEPEGV
jgi:hypothetical protein